jgi:LysR family transcriptional regulator, low CO2-responsive transcriptional regulator
MTLCARAITLNLDSLNSFLVFAEKLNFTHAAVELHISQPALYVKVRELSGLLQVPLYRKIGRRLVLTEQGKRVARFARELLEKQTSFLEELRTGSASQPVILAAGEGTYLYLLGKPIREFLRRSKHPLQLLTLNRDGIIDAVQAGKAHIGVAALESALPPVFESRLFKKVEQILVMPKSHPLAAKRRLQLKDLSGARLIVPPGDRPHRQMLSAFLQSEGVSWEVAVEASGWELMLHFVKLGLGLAVVNSICSIPPGLTGRKLPGLPDVHYHLFNLAGAAGSGPQSELRDMLMNSIS